MQRAEFRARALLSILLAVLALAAAGLALWSLASQKVRLQEERLQGQAIAIADALARQLDAGVPLEDATGFAAAARRLAASDPSVMRVDLLGPARGSVAWVGGRAGEGRALDVPVQSRNPQVGSIGEIAWIRVTIAPEGAVRLGRVDPIALAAAAALALIGVVYFFAIADPTGLRGPAAGRAWVICAAAPALALAAWLVVASGEAYRDRAQASADLLAGRLRAAVDVGLDPLLFSGLDRILEEAGRAAGGDDGVIRLALFEGRRPVFGVGQGSLGALLDPSQFSLNATRSVREGRLDAPPLLIVARVGWGPVLRLTPRDHAAALAALLLYVFGPALLLSLFARRTP